MGAPRVEISTYHDYCTSLYLTSSKTLLLLTIPRVYKIILEPFPSKFAFLLAQQSET